MGWEFKYQHQDRVKIIPARQSPEQILDEMSVNRVYEIIWRTCYLSKNRLNQLDKKLNK